MSLFDKFVKFKSFKLPNRKTAPQNECVFAWIWFFTKPYKWEFLFNSIVHLARHIFFMIAPIFFTKIVALYETGAIENNPNGPYYLITGYAIGQIICFLLWIFIMRRMSICDKITREMSLFAVRHYMNLSISWHEFSGSGSKMQRIMEARKAIFRLYENYFWGGMSFLGVIGAIVVSVAVTDLPAYFIPFFIFYVISYIVLAAYTGLWLLKPTGKLLASIESLASKVYEFINSMATLKIFNLDRHLIGQAHKKELESQHISADINKIKALRWSVISLWATLLICLAGLIGLSEVKNGTMTISSYALIMFLMISTWEKIEGFTRVYTQIVEDYQAMKHLFQNLVFQPTVVERKQPKELVTATGSIIFQNCTFGYIKKNDVFDRLNCEIAPHQKIGLVGSSGAGKTTLMKLLMRFYDLNAGKIMIDGQNIKSVSLASLRQSIAIIPQDAALFNHPVMENIRYGRLDATDAEVIAAAKEAHAHEFIVNLKDGYHTLVGERGVKLSGGQRQRIAIARAILKDAPILVLDEATSALDSESERLIQQSLKTVMAGKTVIAIAHRLSTIARMDRILVMDRGQIIEDGTHDQLIQQDRDYAKMWRLQSDGFLGDG